MCILGYFAKVGISMFCGYEAVFGAFAQYSNEGSDRDSECNPPQNPLTQHGLEYLRTPVDRPVRIAYATAENQRLL